MAHTTLCLGRVGSGKTHYCVEQFLSRFTGEVSEAAPAIFIVPTIEHVNRMRDILVTNHVLDGAFSLSLKTLSQYVTDVASGYSVSPPISMLRREFLLEKIIRACSFKYYGEPYLYDGFVSAMGKLIHELKSQQVTIAGLREAVERYVEHPIMRRKWEDVLNVYSAYQKMLRQEGLIDADDVLLKYCRSDVVDSALSKVAVFIDGFFDFSPDQLMFLQRLSQDIEALFITVTVDPLSENPVIFSLGHETVHRLQRVFPTAVVKTFKGCKRPYSTSMCRFETCFFDGGSCDINFVCPSESSKTAIIYCKSVHDEIKVIAQSIKRRIIDNECSYNEIAVIFRTVDPYIADIRHVFSQYNIPSHIHERYRMKTHYNVYVLMLFIRVCIGGILKDDLVKYFKAVPRRFESGVLSDCELFLSRSHEGAAGMFLLNLLANEESVDSELKEACRSLQVYYDDILKCVTMQDIVDLLRIILVAEGIFSAEVEDYDTETLEVLRRLEEIFEELCQSYCEEMASTEALEIAYKVIDASLYSYSSRSINAVQIYNLGNAKQKEYPVVYIAGMLEGVFPQTITEDPVLKDDEREVMRTAGIALLQRSSYMEYEKYLFYLTATRCLSSLTLTCPQYDSSGKELLPSSYLDEVVRCLGDSVVVTRRKRSIVIPEYRDIYEMHDLWLRVLRDTYNDEQPIVVETLRKEGFTYSARSSATDERYAEKRIRDSAILTMIGQIRGPFSASQLEVYQQCPYRYFLERMARIRAIDTPVDARQRGSIIHAVLERFYKDSFEASKKKDSWILFRNYEKAIKEVERLFYDEVTTRSEIAQEIPMVRVVLLQMLQDLFFMLRNEVAIERARHTCPALFEHGFGVSGSDSPPFDIVFDDGETFSFRGIVDRIDLIHDEGVAVVIDYKGGKKLDKKKFFSGEELQLLLYMKYVHDVLGFSVAGAELYSYKRGARDGIYCESLFDTVGVPKPRKRYTNDEFVDIQKRFLLQVRSCIEGIRGGDISCTPRDCNFCEYNSICRFDKWQLLVNSLDESKDV